MLPFISLNYVLTYQDII